MQKEFSETNENVDVFCYARNWNVLRLVDGLGGLAFAS
jgi:hypothetical protein